MCGQLGVPCSVPEAQRLFERFGYKDRLPYQKFANVLLTQPSRQLASEMPSEWVGGRGVAPCMGLHVMGNVPFRRS